MNKYTVKEFAGLEGVSEQAIYKRIKSKSLKTIKEGGKTFIFSKPSPRADFSQKQETQGKTSSGEHVTALQAHIQDLQNQIKAKDEQIKTKDEQIKEQSQSLMMALKTSMDTSNRIEAYQKRFGLIENSSFKDANNFQSESVAVPVEEVEQEQYKASSDSDQGKRFEKKKSKKDKKKKNKKKKK